MWMRSRQLLGETPRDPGLGREFLESEVQGVKSIHTTSSKLKSCAAGSTCEEDGDGAGEDARKPHVWKSVTWTFPELNTALKKPAVPLGAVLRARRSLGSGGGTGGERPGTGAQHPGPAGQCKAEPPEPSLHTHGGRDETGAAPRAGGSLTQLVAR